MMGNSSLGVMVNYKGVEIPVTHTQFSSHKVKNKYSQQVYFNYKKINVIYSYKSNDLSPWVTVERICEMIDVYGKDWTEHMEESND